MKLIEPTIEYDREIQAFRREFPQSASMDGSNRLMQYERTQDWLEQIELYRNPDKVPGWMVPIRLFIYVWESDRKDIGVMQIRLWLNEYQQHYGGRIGYSICPGER